MDDEYKDEAERWQKAVKLYGQRMATNLRFFGIEVTPDEAEAMALEELKMAVRLNLRDTFYRLIQGKI